VVVVVVVVVVEWLLHSEHVPQAPPTLVPHRTLRGRFAHQVGQLVPDAADVVAVTVVLAEVPVVQSEQSLHAEMAHFAAPGYPLHKGRQVAAGVVVVAAAAVAAAAALAAAARRVAAALAAALLILILAALACARL